MVPRPRRMNFEASSRASRSFSRYVICVLLALMVVKYKSCGYRKSNLAADSNLPTTSTGNLNAGAWLANLGADAGRRTCLSARIENE